MMGRGSVTFSNMVDMMGTSGEEGEAEDCDERVPLLCPDSRFTISHYVYHQYHLNNEYIDDIQFNVNTPHLDNILGKV